MPTINQKTLFDLILSGTIPDYFSKELHDVDQHIITSTRWVNAFDAHTPTRIKIADQLLHKNSAINELSLNDFIQQLNAQNDVQFLWTETLLVPENVKYVWEKIMTTLIDNVAENAKLTAYFSRKLRDLVICRIDNAVGYGVFTLEPISKGEIVTIYAGKLFTDIDADEISHSKYTFNLPSNNLLTFDMQEISVLLLQQCNDYASAMKFQSRHFCQISAEDCGNIARFIQSLPTNEELIANPAKKPINTLDIATNNLEDFFTVYRGWPIVYLEATRDIQAGEQLGFSYGLDYWENMRQSYGINMAFFNHNGEVVLDT